MKNLFRQFNCFLNTSRLIFQDVSHQEVSEGEKQIAEKSTDEISKQKDPNSLMSESEDMGDVLIAKAADSFSVLDSAAEDSDTPPDMLRQLANSEKHKVKYNLAGNPNTPPDVLSKLASDTVNSTERGVSNIQRNLVQNSNLSSADLKLIYENPKIIGSQNFMMDFINNPNTPDDVLKDIISAKDEEASGDFMKNIPSTIEAAKKRLG